MNSLKSKLLLISILPLMVTIILLSIVNLSSLTTHNQSISKLYEKDMISEKQQLIKNQILGIEGMIKAVLLKNNDIKKAKQEIIYLISSVRYLKNRSGYFFAYEQKNSDYYFAFHGTKKHLNGKKTNITKPDVKGFAFRQALIKNGTLDKFTSYHYKKPNTDKILKKMAYSKYIKELNWTLVTGIYIDDVYKQINIMEKINNDNLNQNITQTAIITIILLLISSIVITLIIKKVFITPIHNFKNGIIDFFKYLNKEIDTIKYLNDKSKDEIGIMSKAVNENINKTKNLIEEDNKLINDAKLTMDRVVKGLYNETIQGHTSNKSLELFKDSVNNMITGTKQNFSDINKILEEYAHLDYRNKLVLKNIEEGGVFELLVKDINKLKDAITNMLIDNKQNGLTLQDSSTTLLSNVNNINTSSNKAAVALEETSASLEEITSNISNNTQNVIQMAKYGNDVKNSISKGQNLANQTTKAMDEINTEVTEINDAISVIDQISFQTNILSLNAAVEAATAGEAGKGFAVVAQEVRNLASRSADAANEIKALVQNATNKANNGKKIADEMIDGYTDLNKSISQTLELISSVESASKEQQSEIEQINNAITSLDRQTQQNASTTTATKDIAIQTQNIAQIIVNDVNEKEFIGKN